MAQALYRKYRPKELSSLVGHQTNVDVLRNAAKSNKIGQAYLFYGPRGTGKTTTARLVAKLLNCEKRHTDEEFRKIGEPCNKCPACLEVDNNNSLDVVEIDAASNRGIDEIRNLKEGVRTAPARGGYKVYIIDEAHMLTGPAFNALLKTIEEPPAHAVFILATTEFEKVPATITSRTQRFLFKKISKADIVEKLSKIVKAEKIKIENAALEVIAASADGSLRDAESLLEQINSLSENITLDLAETVLGRASSKKVQQLAELILSKESSKGIEFVKKIEEEGLNLNQIIKDLIRYFEKSLAISLNPALEKSYSGELTAEEINEMKRIVGLADTKRFIAVIKGLIRAYSEMRYSPFPSVPLNVFLAETSAID